MEIEQNIFFDEFKNKLIILENSLIDVQNGKHDKNAINEIFRAIHTIKGTADLLGMFSIVSLTHKAEDLLEYVRSDKIILDTEICNLYLELKNFITLLVDNVSQGIFDDSEAEKLFIEFEKEFNKYIQIAKMPLVNHEEVKTILVIDDAALIRYMIKKIALDEGYHVLTSDNFEDGCQKIKDNVIDLLFCDFSSMNDNPLKLVKIIEEKYKKKIIPIVILLSKEDNEFQELGKSISAKAWLRKPIEENKLKVILEKMLKKN